MKKISLKYSLSGCLKLFFRNPIMSLASLCLLASTLVMFAFTFAVTQNIDSISENEGNVCIFLSDECDENAVSGVRDILSTLTKDGIVDYVDYVSKSEALEAQKERYPEYSKLFASFNGENSPFKASYTVSVVDEYGYSKVKKAVTDLTFEKLGDDGETLSYNPIHSVYDDGDAIVEIENLGDNIVSVLGVLIPITLLVCIVLISAVVRMGIFDKREEISLMRLIGATHGYISTQFVFEGLLIGLLSSVGAIIAVRLMYNGIITKIAEGIKLFSPLAFSQVASGVIIICLAFGILSGVAGSLIATTRYIRKD